MPDQYKHAFAELNSLPNHLKWILACNNERELTQIFRKNGKDEDPRFAKIVKLFRDLLAGRLTGQFTNLGAYGFRFRAGQSSKLSLNDFRSTIGSNIEF